MLVVVNESVHEPRVELAWALDVEVFALNFHRLAGLDQMDLKNWRE